MTGRPHVRSRDELRRQRRPQAHTCWDHLFIAPSFPFLRRELEALVRRFGIPVLG